MTLPEVGLFVIDQRPVSNNGIVVRSGLVYVLRC